MLRESLLDLEAIVHIRQRQQLDEGMQLVDLAALVHRRASEVVREVIDVLVVHRDVVLIRLLALLVLVLVDVVAVGDDDPGAARDPGEFAPGRQAQLVQVRGVAHAVGLRGLGW